ncbi:3'-5' exonuclease [Pseudonocardia xinjiangensis]|uniref:3'-5' exonuclease n=1 Tax=Pseudonocardia xinjiangensis TaxID=75289 RepID=A0ABX1RAP0_9PSEU|nr:3'-5' exonuclease [Pseudonocardia xinjiangensis]NMH76851.1 3'-5' exonuclease [Pseudonocardia xinjiangensis]
MYLSTPTALADQQLAVVDVQGNGQQPPEIVDIAVLPIEPAAVVREASMRVWLVRPTRPITPRVTHDVHGIRNSDVLACPGWARVADEVHASIRGRVLVAHNAAVELRVIAAHLPAWRPSLVLDTARLARRVWPGLPGGYGLSRLATHAGLHAPHIQPGERRHRAGYETWMTGQLLFALALSSGLTWEQLVDAARVPDHDPESA